MFRERGTQCKQKRMHAANHMTWLMYKDLNNSLRPVKVSYSKYKLKTTFSWYWTSSRESVTLRFLPLFSLASFKWLVNRARHNWIIIRIKVRFLFNSVYMHSLSGDHLHMVAFFFPIPSRFFRQSVQRHFKRALPLNIISFFIATLSYQCWIQNWFFSRSRVKQHLFYFKYIYFFFIRWRQSIHKKTL